MLWGTCGQPQYVMIIYLSICLDLISSYPSLLPCCFSSLLSSPHCCPSPFQRAVSFSLCLSASHTPFPTPLLALLSAVKSSAVPLKGRRGEAVLKTAPAFRENTLSSFSSNTSTSPPWQGTFVLGIPTN